MVNYVLSFCKITGASKIFSRNFYLPLLKPITPKDALRTFRITGKWLLGAKIQHYIPVLLNHKKKRSKKAKNYGKKPHEKTDDYTYMTPVLDPENESHKLLLNILEQKNNKNLFVYTVEDKKYNIVLKADLEVAIRNGDIIDVLVSQHNDKIIVKLKNFKKVPIEIEYFDNDDDKIFHGEGATSPDEEKFHHHGKYTMSLAKIFEDKELVEEKWEEELKKIMRRRKRQAGEGSKEWKAMIKETIRNLGRRFEEEAKKVIEEIAEPAEEQTIDMAIENLETTKNVNETLMKNDGELLDQLPTMKEIPDIIRSMGNATLTEIDDVSGVKVKLSSGKECFVSGQMVKTEDGDVFVPGQTVENEFGLEYAPGITININNKPTLINGLIMGEEETSAMFLPTQSTITADGQLTFATTPEERPNVQPEKKRPKIVPQEEEEEVVEDNSDESVELNNSELEELDIELINQKHEKQRMELDKLKMILYDDGMDDLIASLEEKKAKLKQKLEELRKLSINKENNLVSYISDNDTMEIAAKITNNKELINRISDILMTIIRRAATFRDRNNINPDNINHPFISVPNMTETDIKFNNSTNKLKVLLKTIIVAVNDVFKTRPKDQILALNAIGEIIVDVLKNDDKTLDSLLNLTNTHLERIEVCNTIFKQLTQNMAKSKLSKLKKIASEKLTIDDTLGNIEKILEKENETKCEAFVKLAKQKPEILAILRDNLGKSLDKIKTEEEALSLLDNSIVTATNQIIENSLECLQPSEFLAEALSFARALDLKNTETDLNTANQENYQKTTFDLVKRVILIKHLTEKDYSLKTALERLKKNPERSRNDPRIRQLIRESAVLCPQKAPIKTSRDIPTNLLKTQNLLAIEDFLMQRTNVDLPVLINRNTMQAVVPKEAARGVLAGRVSYALIDESGVTHFKPMHMFSAINNINKNREKRIDDYLSVGRFSNDNTESRKFLQNRTSNVRKPPLNCRQLA